MDRCFYLLFYSYYIIVYFKWTDNHTIDLVQKAKLCNDKYNCAIKYTEEECCRETNNIYAVSNNHNILYTDNANSNCNSDQFIKSRHGF